MRTLSKPVGLRQYSKHSGSCEIFYNIGTCVEKYASWMFQENVPLCPQDWGIGG